MSGYLIFGGIDSRDYDVFVSFSDIDTVPRRVYTKVDIVGKNGAVLIDEGKYEDVPHSYDCIVLDNEKRVAFVNAIMSKKGYQRLTDSYGTDEYYTAVLEENVEQKTTRVRDKFKFKLVFTRKPQRFLLSGEVPTEYTVGMSPSDEQTKTGSIVTFEAEEGTIISDVKADINPVQDLHGYDKPWSRGNGKNKLPSRNATVTTGGLTFSCDGDGVYHISGTSTSTYPQWLIENGTLTFPVGTTFTLSNTFINAPSGAFIYCILYERDTPTGTNLASRSTRNRDSVTFTIEHPYQAVVIVAEGNGIAYSNTTIASQLEIGSTATSFAPYSNICPISGWDEAKVYVSPTTSEQDATVYTIDLDGTRYGGTLDVTSGVLTLTEANLVLGSLTWTKANTQSGKWRFNGAITSDVKRVSAITETPDMICSHYVAETPNDTYNGVVGISTNTTASSTPYLYVCDMNYSDEASFKQMLTDTNAQLVYELATPITVQLTPTEVNTLLGTNHVWANSGNVTVKYGTNPYVIMNPTPFDAQPLLKVTGKGVLGIGDYIITITGDASQVIYIDCDSMEIYKNTGGIITPAGSLVSFATNEFPKLPSGVSGVSLGTGIAEVEITPRWWII